MKLPPRYVPTGDVFTSGGMSSTTVCKDSNLDRLVVIKSLHAGVESRRILDELAALEAIRSKHVVQIYDVIRDTEGRVIAIVEEYLSGKDLTEVAKPSSENQFLKLIYPIAEGIADIHAHNRVHRDIKRQNMKYDVEGCLKIFDFGLAREEAINASTVGEIGTPGYMAPELFEATKGGRTMFTQAVDTFAFGATALAIALGKLPAELRKMPPDLSRCKDNFSNLPFPVPAAVAALLGQCMDSVPSNRPAMDAVAAEIARHLLRDKHRALLVSGGQRYQLDQSNRTVDLSVANQGSLRIRYDGLSFEIDQVEGDVAINNVRVANGYRLPGSCVIVLGSPTLQTLRTNITVDVSHPEVAI